MLLQVGFHTLDFGSFVSEKAIPQMRDTAHVLEHLKTEESSTKLLAIVANQRGAQEAITFKKLDSIGFPFSISETFQLRNTNTTIEVSFNLLKTLRDLCETHKKEFVVYLSMAFGNPYNEPYAIEQVVEWADILISEGIKVLYLADTCGNAQPHNIRTLFKTISSAHPAMDLGLHLHAAPSMRLEKIEAAWEAGCKRMDTTIRGYGGCPLASDALIGNLPTEELLAFLNFKGVAPSLNLTALEQAQELASHIFHSNTAK